MGLRSDELGNGMSIQEKLEQQCPPFVRMKDLFGEKANITLAALLQLGTLADGQVDELDSIETGEPAVYDADDTAQSRPQLSSRHEVDNYGSDGEGSDMGWSLPLSPLPSVGTNTFSDPYHTDTSEPSVNMNQLCTPAVQHVGAGDGNTTQSAPKSRSPGTNRQVQLSSCLAIPEPTAPCCVLGGNKAAKPARPNTVATSSAKTGAGQAESSRR